MADILNLAEAKEYLGISASETIHDAELPMWISALNPVVAKYLGQSVSTDPVTETHYPSGYGPIILRREDLTAVTSVTEYVSGTGTVLTLEDHDTEGTYDLRSGMLYRRSGWASTTWPSGVRVVVVYPSVFTGDLLKAVKLGAGEILRHAWHKTQNGARAMFGAPDADDTFVPIPPNFGGDIPDVAKMWLNAAKSQLPPVA